MKNPGKSGSCKCYHAVQNSEKMGQKYINLMTSEIVAPKSLNYLKLDFVTEN